MMVASLDDMRLVGAESRGRCPARSPNTRICVTGARPLRVLGPRTQSREERLAGGADRVHAGIPAVRRRRSSAGCRPPHRQSQTAAGQRTGEAQADQASAYDHAIEVE